MGLCMNILKKAHSESLTGYITRKTFYPVIEHKCMMQDGEAITREYNQMFSVVLGLTQLVSTSDSLTLQVQVMKQISQPKILH